MKRAKVLSIVAGSVVLRPDILFAAQGETLLPSIGRLIIAFVVVVTLIYVSIFVFRRFFFSGKGKSSGCIKPLGSIPLGQRARLFIVEIAGRAFLLGVTDHEVSTIAEFDPREFDELPSSSRITSFVKQLQNLSNRDRGAKESSTG